MTDGEHQSNFGFLGKHDQQFVRRGMLAERYFRDDPNTCHIKLRQLGELLAQEVAAQSGAGHQPRFGSAEFRSSDFDL